MEYQVCNSCRGNGHFRRIPCPRCDGMGRVRIPLRAIAIKKEKRTTVSKR
jgi:DnaJ-class molecular chaperone